ncbi:MAG TPA: hypothetical protein VHY48_09710 [Acidobacteriaceae bacterium]|jgi:hypothetical protein|nr:hypothetical protein [Acidobacteriaceae bacterium]
MLADPNRIRSPFTEKEKLAAQEQLERLLANPFFSHSRRFPSFLRFIVTRTLLGETDLLKERTLGVEIFGKDADYDTANDPIVRVTAAEIRKRIAQYYQDPAHEHELRLSLPPGSYIPHFHSAHLSADNVQSAMAPSQAEATGLSATTLAPDTAASARRRWLLPVASVFALALLTAIGGVLWRLSRPSPLDVFWGPVLNSSDPVLFCIADQTQYTAIALRDAADPSHQEILHDNLTAVVIDDLTPIVRIAGFLQSNRKKYSVRGEGSTTLMDLRNGPTVFIGAYDNAWTLRLLKPLRYHFFNDATMTHFGILDSRSNLPSTWTVDRAQQIATNNYRDYAIVARFTDVTTGRLAVVVAGVGRGGTIAGGEFLTDANMLAPIVRSAGDKRNVELVLSTPIIGGEPGPPRIEASYIW